MFKSSNSEGILKYVFAEQAVVVGRQFSPVAGRTQAKSMPFNISMMDRVRGGGILTFVLLSNSVSKCKLTLHFSKIILMNYFRYVEVS